MKELNVIIGCEESGVVRRAFRNLGHNAWSCDLLPARDGSEFHYQRDIFDVLRQGEWDLGVFFPPCTYLSNSGVRWLYNKDGSRNEQRWADMKKGAEFFKWILGLKIPHMAIENPIQHKYAREIIGTPYTQWFQPFHFGHGEIKRTHLWLKNLPPLVPTNVVEGRVARVHRMAPGPNRTRDRSETYAGVAQAMAHQWSDYLSKTK